MLLFGLLLAGPLIGVAAFATSAQPPPPVVEHEVEAPSEVVELATRYVTAYLSATDRDELAEWIELPPGGDLPGIEPVTVLPGETNPEGDRWQIVVTAVTAEGAAHTYLVRLEPSEPSGDAKTDMGWRPVELPGRVASTAVTAGRPDWNRAPSNDARVGTAIEWLGAYLTGGDADRYASPNFEPQPLEVAPFTDVAIDAGSVDGPEERPRVTLTVTATTSDGDAQPLSYVLELGARDGRWEITDLFPTPPQPEPEQGDE